VIELVEITRLIEPIPVDRARRDHRTTTTFVPMVAKSQIAPDMARLTRMQRCASRLSRIFAARPHFHPVR